MEIVDLNHVADCSNLNSKLGFGMCFCDEEIAENICIC
jgi:hypothetical protein